MKRIMLAVAASSLVLSACASPGTPDPQPTPGPIVTPARCQAVLAGVDQAGRVVDLLVSFGIARSHADIFATLLAVGKLSVAGLCALFLPGKPLPRPGPLPPPPSGE